MKKYLLLILIGWLLASTVANAQNTAVPDSFVYSKAGTTELKAYVFRPKADGKTHPAILLFHGGGWQLGEAAWNFDRAKEFAAKGMVGIAVEYRLANNGLSPADGVEDAFAAFAWARQNAKKLGINIKKVAGYGVSAGGHLVTAAATLPVVKGKKVTGESRPNVILLYSPALNMATDPYFVRLMSGHGNAADYSPSGYITSKLPPTLIIQGQQDSIVFTKDAVDFRDKAQKAGATCRLYIYPGVGHLLTRNIKIQYKDFDSDSKFAADAHQREDRFLDSLGYFKK